MSSTDLSAFLEIAEYSHVKFPPCARRIYPSCLGGNSFHLYRTKVWKTKMRPFPSEVSMVIIRKAKLGLGKKRPGWFRNACIYSRESIALRYKYRSLEDTIPRTESVGAFLISERLIISAFVTKQYLSDPNPPDLIRRSYVARPILCVTLEMAHTHSILNMRPSNTYRDGTIWTMRFLSVRTKNLGGR